MKKLIRTSLFLLFFISVAYPQLNYDNVTNLQMGMGIFYKKYMEYSKPWIIHVLEIDLNVPYNSIETIKGQNRLAGYEKTTSMARRRSLPGHIAVGAVNGDFFDGTGTPINIQIRDGELLRKHGWMSTLGFSDQKKPMLARVLFSGSVKKGTATTAINGVNETRAENQLVLFNKYKGASTATNQYGTEVAIKAITPWYANDTVICIVTAKVIGVGSMSLNDSTAVLSGHGTSGTFLQDNFSVGDTIKLFTGITPGVSRLKELIGGFPKIIFNGANYVDQGYLEEGGPSHTYERHPRTAIGFSQDSSKVYLVAVDGRQNNSIGMTLHELANFMLYIGVHQAINLDGGGSTTMVVRDSIVNTPSDGGERTVANAIAVFTSAPQGTLNRIKISPQSYRLFHTESIQFTAYGFDEYFNPVPVNQSSAVFSMTPSLGSLIGNTLTAGNDPDTGYVYLNYQGYKDSAQIIVKGITNISLTPVNAVTDSSRIVEFKAQAYDLDGTPRNIALNQYIWSVTNPLIGSIDTIGRFKGKSNGLVGIIANHRGVTDTSWITVEIGTSKRLLSGMDAVTGWSLTSLNMDTIATKISISTDTLTTAPGSLKIDYKFTYDMAVTNYIYLKTDLPVFGVPDSIHIDVKGNGPQHHVTYIVSDENEENFKISMAQYITSVMFLETKTAVNRAVPAGTTGTLYFPIRLKEIQIKMSCSKVQGQVYTGTIYFDNLLVSYPSDPATSVEDETIPSKFGLWGNYPNPFNPETKINFSIEKAGYATLEVYDITGSRIDRILASNFSLGRYSATWNARNFPSGVYFAVLNFEGNVKVHKMVLMK